MIFATCSLTKPLPRWFNMLSQGEHANLGVRSPIGSVSLFFIFPRLKQCDIGRSRGVWLNFVFNFLWQK